MYSVKDKIELFNKMIFTKNKNEKEIEIESLKKSYEYKLEKLRRKQQEIKKEEINKTKKEAEKEKRQIISKAKVRVQKNILEKQGEILVEFNKYLYENIDIYLATEDYKNYLKRELNKIKKEISEEDEIKIFLRKKDEGIMEISKYNINYANDILGGFYIIKNDNVKYDCTIKTKIEENSNYIGNLLKETLNNKEGVNIES